METTQRILGEGMCEIRGRCDLPPDGLDYANSLSRRSSVRDKFSPIMHQRLTRATHWGLTSMVNGFLRIPKNCNDMKGAR